MLWLWLSFGIAAVGATFAIYQLYATASRELRTQGGLALREQSIKAQERIHGDMARLQSETIKALASLHIEGLGYALQRWDEAEAAILGTFQWTETQGFSPPELRGTRDMVLKDVADAWASQSYEPARLGHGYGQGRSGNYRTFTGSLRDNPNFPAAEMGYQQENLDILAYAGRPVEPRAGWVLDPRVTDAPWIFWYRAGPGAPVRGCIVDPRPTIRRLQFEFSNRGQALVQLAPLGSVPGGEIIPGYTLVTNVGEFFEKRQSSTRLMALMAGWMLGIFALGAGGLAMYSRREMRDAERKATFVTQVSHELRTPLTSIRMFSDMLGAEEVPTEKRVKFAGTISRESARLGALIERLLTFNALEKGKHQAEVSPIEVGPVVRETVEEMEATLHAAGMRIEAELPPEAVVALTDRGTLKQALLNLLDNALKYARAGGVVRLAVAADAKGVRVRVADAGPGVPRELGQRVFEPFVQGGRSLTDKSPGVGLGLSIARGLLRAAGGDLVLVSSESGAVFEIRLPRAAPAS
ncbi:MAG: HAMP domain-containing sensor histidine kinase [Verrucomicrobiota bacterium]